MGGALRRLRALATASLLLLAVVAGRIGLRRLRSAALVALAFLALLGGFAVWNLTGIPRAEWRVHRLVRGGMTREEVQSVMDRTRVQWYSDADCGRLCRVENYVVGYADLVFRVHYGPDGRVRDVTTEVQTSFL